MANKSSFAEPVSSMVTQYEQGSTLAEIGKNFGCSPSHVYQVFKRHGIERHMKGRLRHEDTTKVEAMIALYRAGKTLVEISQIYGVSASTVHTKFKKQGVSKHDRYVPPFDVQYDVKQIERMYRSGQDYALIGQALGMSGWRVRKIIQDNEITKTRTVENESEREERVAQMAAQYRSGATLSAIAREYGITRQRVQQLFKKYDVVRDSTVCTHCGATDDVQVVRGAALNDSLHNQFDCQDKFAREKLMLAMGRSGQRPEHIAKLFGLTRQRVMQIFKKHKFVPNKNICPACAMG